MGKLKHKSKNFCQKLCDQFDGPAKNAARRWLENQGFEIQESQDVYGADLIGIINNPTLDFQDPIAFDIQVEIKNNWTSGSKPFPFCSVDLPGRRAKSLKNPNTLFLIFSSDLRGVLIIEPWQHGTGEEISKTPRNTNRQESFLRFNNFIEKNESSNIDFMPAAEWELIEF